MNGTLKTGFRIMLALTMLSAVLASNTQSSSAATTGCINIAITGNSGFVTQAWSAAPTGEACLALHIQEPTEGKFNITAGWVFIEPLKVNGEVIPTHTVEGQLAPQIDPISFPVMTGDILTVEPTWNPNGTEVGFWWNYTKIITYTENMSFGTFQIKKNWAGVPGDTGQLVMNFPSAGTVDIAGGWTFDQNIKLNNNPVETFPLQGQTALGIKPFKLNVNEGDAWTWTQNMENGNAELGLSLTYSPKRYLLYLPLIAKPIEILNAEAELNEGQGLQVISASWPQAIPGQGACLNVTFNGTSSEALMESGWILGTTITSAKLNNIPINIAVLPPASGETALRISQATLASPQKLEICIVGTGLGLEIGLRIKYPAP